MLEVPSDWYVLTTINAPRPKDVTGDELEGWLRGQGDLDTGALEAFFYECDLGAQLGFLRGHGIPVEQALATLDRHIRPRFPKEYRFHIDVWRL